MVEPQMVGPEHRAAAIDRPAVAVHPDDIDIRSPRRDSLFEDFGALVDHRQQAALRDFGIADLPPGDASARREIEDQRLHLRRRRRQALGIIVVIAAPGLLAASILLAEDLAKRRPGRGLARPAEVETGEIGHGERPHRQAEIVEHPVDVPGQRPFEDELLRLALARRQHAVADEAMADADGHGDLAEPLGQRHRGRQHRRRRRRAAHHFDEPHEVGRREEMQPEHMVRAGHRRGDGVNVEVGGVGGEDRARLGNAIERGEDVAFGVHQLEHRLDHEVAGGQCREVAGAGQAGHAGGGLVRRDSAFAGRGLQRPADRRQPALQRVRLRLDDRHRKAGIEERRGDAAPHRAGADDAHARDRQGLGAIRDVRDAGRLPLGEKHVALRGGLGAGDELFEQRALPGEPVFEGEADGRLDGGDTGGRRREATEPLGVAVAERGEEVVAAAIGGDLLIAVPHPARGALPPLRKGDGGGHRIVGDHVDEPALMRRRRIDRRAERDHLERRLRSDQPGQALRAAGAGHQPELDLRLAQRRRRCGDPRVAGQRQLEAAAQRHPVDRRDDRLAAGVQCGEQVVEGRRLRWPAEFLDVGAAAEAAPGAGDDDRRNCRFGVRLSDGGLELTPQR